MESPKGSGPWYVAVLVVRSRVGNDADAVPLLDRQVRLLRAPDADSAYQRALALGAAEALSYQNAAGETVTWEFAGLHDLAEVPETELTDGVEVYSWRTRGHIDDAVVPKERLTVFWSAANAHHTARDLLAGHRDRAV
jgi:hypothetical protein